MPLIADYSIIADAVVLEKDKSVIDFTVPSNIHTGSRVLLGFMCSVDNNDDLLLRVRFNGTQVWSRNFESGNRTQFFLEVVQAGAVKPGANNLSFISSSTDFNVVELSDIVIWWQANI